MALPNGRYSAYVSVTFGVWVRRSGAWQKVTQVYGQWSGEKTNGGNGPYGVYWDGTLNLGTGIEAFGVTVDAVDGGTAATSTAITRAKWTAQGSSGGVRTALPNGSTTTITVRPRG